MEYLDIYLKYIVNNLNIECISVMRSGLDPIEVFRDAWSIISRNLNLLMPFLLAGIISIFIHIPYPSIYELYMHMPSIPNRFNIRIILSPLISIGYLILSIIGIIIVYYIELVGFRGFYNYITRGISDYTEAVYYVFNRFIKFLIIGIIAIILILIIVTIPIGYLMIMCALIDDLGVIESLEMSIRIASSDIVLFLILMIASIVIYAIASIIPVINPILTELAIGYIGLCFLIAYMRLR